jgi:hypothetical protein
MNPKSCKEVKSGGRITQKSAGTMPSGKPRISNRSGSEYSQASAGTSSGSLSKGRAEYAQKSAGK